ncbi:MAG TPA: DinB family protein [Gemmatimonadales bacterium]|nr:DinB family protein [Gemmatimonadales bacterium]
MPLHPRTSELIEYLARTRTDLVTALDQVPAPLRERRPAPDAWSPAEIAEHLRVVEDGIVRMLNRTLDRTDLDALGPEADTSSVLGCLDRFRLLDATRRIEAPELVRPAADVTFEPALAGLAKTRDGMIALLARVDGRAVGSITRPHLLLGPLTFYQWIVFVGQHEARHTHQVRATAARLQA